MNNANDAISTTARSLRQALGLSLEDVALASRGHGYALTSGRLSELERGLRCWSSKMIDAVAAGLGVTTGRLLKGSAAQADGGGDAPMIAPGGPPGKKRPATAA
jgi:transcriptional regulator with XRE-family HTH domain